METTIKYQGLIHFNPVDVTKKHQKQSDWKRIAMINFEGEICQYYSWFLNKRYGIMLNKPLRNAHVSFINDSIYDIQKALNKKDIDADWENLKAKYNRKPMEIELDLFIKSNGKHWWINVSESSRIELNKIRSEIGLGKPFFGLHMSVGYVNEYYEEQSNYILNICTKFGKEYN